MTKTPPSDIPPPDLCTFDPEDNEGGEDEEEDGMAEDEGSHNNNDTRKYLVDGAGTPSIDGVYKSDGTRNDVGRYTKFGVYLGKRVLFVLHQCRALDMSKRWFISIEANAQVPAGSVDVDFYSVRVTENCLEYPPVSGWSNDALQGRDPPPTVTLFHEEQEEEEKKKSGGESLTLEDILKSYDDGPVPKSTGFGTTKRKMNEGRRSIVTTADFTNNKTNDSAIITSDTFEINVAIIGYVSVGKTTVLNALLQDKFSEVSMRRTTAGINKFCIVSSTHPPSAPPPPPAASASKRKPAASGNEESSLEGEPCRKVAKTHGSTTNNNNNMDSIVPDAALSAKSTLTKIVADNGILREMKNNIQERSFDIELNEQLCHMRNDTRLVLIDIPGLNEADSDDMYRQYVEERWNSLDCAIVVMDAEKGVNTDEQVELLKFIKKNLDDSKNIPVIVLCNKVDDPDDEDLMTLVREMQAKVEEIFRVQNRKESLEEVLAAYREGKHNCDGMEFPIFLPLSAGNAFSYRVAASCYIGTPTKQATDQLRNEEVGSLKGPPPFSASWNATSCSFEKFKQLDIKLIDKVGRDEVGTFKWKKFSLEQKYKTAFDAVSNAEQYNERLEATNFDKFLAVLAYSVGGEDNQRRLLEKQFKLSLQQLDFQDGSQLLANKLAGVFHKCKLLKTDATYLKNKFWQLYNPAATKVFNASLKYMDTLPFIELMDELIAYNKFVQHAGWAKDECKKIVEKMDELVSQQFTIILEHESKWNIGNSDLGRYECRYVWEDEKWIQLDEGRSSKSIEEKYPWHFEWDGSGWQNVHTDDRIAGEPNPVSGNIGVSWKTLTYQDWVTILSSLLLPSYSKHFCERFGREKILLETRLQRHALYANGLAVVSTKAEKRALANTRIFTEGGYFAGEFVPKDPLKYNTVYQIENPKLLSSPSHWGHLVWKFCDFMDKTENQS